MSALVQPDFGADLLNAQIYSELATASRLIAGLNNRPVSPAVDNEEYKARLNRLLTGLNRSLRAMLGALEPLAARGLPSSDEALEAIASTRHSVVESYRVCSRILKELEGQDWPRGERLAELSGYRERLLDLIDWMDAVAERDEIEAKFQQALTEMAAGDVVPWPAA